MILFLYLNNIFVLSQLLIVQSLPKSDESAVSIKLSDGVRFEGLKVYFSKINNNNVNHYPTWVGSATWITRCHFAMSLVIPGE